MSASASAAGNASSLSAAAVVRQCGHCLPAPVVIGFSCLFACLVIFGSLGNVFVIGSVVQSKKLRRAPINWLLLHLAVADAGNLLAIMPDVAISLCDTQWRLPALACPLCRYLQEFFLYASLLLQMLICVERFIVICVPLQKERLLNKAYVLRMISILWGVASALALPYALLQRRRELQPMSWWVCDWDVADTWHLDILQPKVPWSFLLAFKWFECLTLYFIPLALMTFLYGQTVVKLRDQKAMEPMYANRSITHAVVRLRKNVVKMLVISISIYYFCYSPIQTIFLCEYMMAWRLYLPMWMRWSLNALTLSSSAANPLVYIVYHRQYRDRFVSLMDRLHMRCVTHSLRKDSAPIAMNLMNPAPANAALRAHMAFTARVSTVDRQRGSADTAGGGAAEAKKLSSEDQALQVSFASICQQASQRRRLAYNELFEHV